MIVKPVKTKNLEVIKNYSNRAKRNTGITYIHDPNFGAINMATRSAKQMTTAVSIMPYVLVKKN